MDIQLSLEKQKIKGKALLVKVLHLFEIYHKIMLFFLHFEQILNLLQIVYFYSIFEGIQVGLFPSPARVPFGPRELKKYLQQAENLLHSFLCIGMW